jgi:hypothetical protein
MHGGETPELQRIMPVDQRRDKHKHEDNFVGADMGSDRAAGRDNGRKPGV